MKSCVRCNVSFNRDHWTCPSCGFTPRWEGSHYCFSPDIATGDASFDLKRFELVRDFEPGSFWYESRNRLIIWLLRRFFPTARNLFEIGCGTGLVLSAVADHFPQMAVAGSDVYPEGLAYAKKRVDRASLYQMDARHIPFFEEFDIIGAFDVLEHIDEDGLALAQMFRAVRRGGGVIVSVPQHQTLWGHGDDRAKHKRRYSRQELLQKVGNAGFRVLYTTSFFFFLLPLMFASRVSQRIFSKPCDTLDELKTTEKAGAILSPIMSLEFGLIRMGLSLPVGGSLFLVAQKST